MHSPVLCIVAVEVVLPIADSVLLVKSCVVSAHMGNAASVFVAHVEELTVKFLVGVEPDGSVCAVESECYVGELLPSLHLHTTQWIQLVMLRAIFVLSFIVLFDNLQVHFIF